MGTKALKTKPQKLIVRSGSFVRFSQPTEIHPAIIAEYLGDNKKLSFRPSTLKTKLVGRREIFRPLPDDPLPR